MIQSACEYSCHLQVTVPSPFVHGLPRRSDQLREVWEQEVSALESNAQAAAQDLLNREAALARDLVRFHEAKAELDQMKAKVQQDKAELEAQQMQAEAAVFESKQHDQRSEIEALQKDKVWMG